MAAVITGAKAYVKMNGDLVLFCSGVSVQHDDNLEEIPQLDSLEVAEYAENGHRCTITMNTIKLASNAEIGGQRVANNARDYKLDFTKDLKEKLTQGEIIIEIVEAVPVRNGQGDITSFSETPIYVGFGCKFAGGTGQIDSKGLWQGTWTFKCRRGVGI